MTSNDRSSKPRQPAPLARLLAFALLVFVSYGATAEVAHKHGNVAPECRGGLAANINSSDNTESSSSNARSGSECLICQLHQHLFVSLFNALPQVAPPPDQALRAPASAVSYPDHANTPQRGRAPPTASLL